MTVVHVLLPPGVDDPARPSGGNRYDRRACDGLRAHGWDVREHVVPGGWPRPSSDELRTLDAVLEGVPDSGLVLVDGLIGSAAATPLVPAAERLRVVVLVHMPAPDGVGGPDEHAVLRSAAAVVTTSEWTRARLLERPGIQPRRVHVARPGVGLAAPSHPRPDGSRLLAVGAVVPHKGQDLLLAALRGLRDLRWSCSFAGSLDRDPGFVAGLRERAAADGIEDRVRFVGALDDRGLDGVVAASDLLVMPSRTESFGMVVPEAVAAGLPVIAFDVGGIREALGGTARTRPGILVPPADVGARARALRDWLEDPDLRARLRARAALRNRVLPGWDRTVVDLERALRAAAAEPSAAIDRRRDEEALSR